MTTAQMPSPEEVRNYILRRLPDEARGRFEEAYFRDDAILERVEDEEDRLVSDYVLGRLDEADRRRFEGALLGSPYYRLRVETTGALRHAARPQRGAGPVRRSPVSPRDGSGRDSPSTDGARSHHVTLLPGRTGTAVAFALLVILLVAAVLAAWTLRRDLVALRRKIAAPGARPQQEGPLLPPPPVASERAAFLVLDDPEPEGPKTRRLPPGGGPVVLVIPAYQLPAETQGATFVLLDETGSQEWKSGTLPRSEQAAGGIVARLPDGLPVSGRGALLLVPEGGTGPARLLAVLLRDDPSAERSESRPDPYPGSLRARNP